MSKQISVQSVQQLINRLQVVATTTQQKDLSDRQVKELTKKS